MTYKGYEGKVKFDEKPGIFHGEVINTKDVITFQGKSVDELKRAFHESVDDYLDFCGSRGEEPEKPFSGKFIVRLSSEMHKRAQSAARREGLSLNAWVIEAIKQRVGKAARASR